MIRSLIIICSLFWPRRCVDTGHNLGLGTIIINITAISPSSAQWDRLGRAGSELYNVKRSDPNCIIINSTDLEGNIMKLEGRNELRVGASRHLSL